MPTHNDSPDGSVEQPCSGRGANVPYSEGHLSDADVAALVHGAELGRTITGTMPSTAQPPTLEELRVHTDTCDACSRRVANARTEDKESALLLSVLDVPAPAFDAGSVLARAKERGRTNRSRADRAFPTHSLPAPASVPAFKHALVPSRRHGQYRYAIAASFLFAAIGVTALAFPGSPLRRLWEDAGQKSGAATVRAVKHVTLVNTSGGISASSVAIAPAPDFTIDFHGTSARLPRLTVRYCDTTFATLHVLRPGALPSTALNAPSDATPTQAAVHPERFSVSADRIIVMVDSSAVAGEAIYELIVPNSTRSLSVTARGKAVTVRRVHSAEGHSADRCDPPITVAQTP